MQPIIGIEVKPSIALDPYGKSVKQTVFSNKNRSNNVTFGGLTGNLKKNSRTSTAAAGEQSFNIDSSQKDLNASINENNDPSVNSSSGYIKQSKLINDQAIIKEKVKRKSLKQMKNYSNMVKEYANKKA